MALRRSKPITFKPRGCTDSVDATNAPQGSMQSLSNLVPAPFNASIFVPRPAAVNVAMFSNVLGGTALLVVGSRVYGMIASTAVAGKDAPFCYDFSTSAAVTISGFNSGNLPDTQATTGAWQPPHMEMVGTTILVSHVGFNGTSNFFGWIDVSNPAVPVWNAGNTTVNALPSVPNWVSQFNGRAWYACGNSEVFSDALAPLVVTNATQVVTLGDSTPITAAGPLGLTSTTSGGVVQALVVFKGTQQPYQVTGDPATMNLTVNTIAGAVGTSAPNTVTPTPLGLSYVAIDGLRILDTYAHCSDPIGANGQGISVPFIYSLVPSRMCAAFQRNTLVVSTQNGLPANQPFQEWWLDFSQSAKAWTGPHSFAGSIMAAMNGPSGTSWFGLDIVKFAVGVDAMLWAQATIPLPTSTYTENGTVLQWSWLTSLLPDNTAMAMNDLNETSVGMIIPDQESITCLITDEAGNVLNTYTIMTNASGGATWDSFNWGAGNWGAIAGYFQQYQIEWSAPVVFKQAQIQLTGPSGANRGVGNLYMRYQILGYLLQNAG